MKVVLNVGGLISLPFFLCTLVANFGVFLFANFCADYFTDYMIVIRFLELDVSKA